jgi:hypothetical protein
MNEVTTNPAVVRIEAIEEELATLRKKLQAQTPDEPKVVLEGVWADVVISDEEINEVKNSWMKKFDDIV